VEQRLLILAAAFASLLVALVGFMVSLVRAARKREESEPARGREESEPAQEREESESARVREESEPAQEVEESSLPLATGGVVDTDLDDLHVVVAPDSPSAELLAPLGADSWQPPAEPAPSARLAEVSLAQRIAAHQAAALASVPLVVREVEPPAPQAPAPVSALAQAFAGPAVPEVVPPPAPTIAKEGPAEAPEHEDLARQIAALQNPTHYLQAQEIAPLPAVPTIVETPSMPMEGLLGERAVELVPGFEWLGAETPTAASEVVGSPVEQAEATPAQAPAPTPAPTTAPAAARARPAVVVRAPAAPAPTPAPAPPSGWSAPRPRARVRARLEPSEPSAGVQKRQLPNALLTHGSRAEAPELIMAAPVEMWFGDVRVGVKAGTKTHGQFRRYADILLGDLKGAGGRAR